MVIAVYHDDFAQDAWARLEIYHDPGIGYIPRAARYTVATREGAACRESLLIGARPCSAGGFVPTDVYEADFEIAVPTKIGASEFDEHSPRPAPRGKINMRHLEATNFRNEKGPVGLEWPGTGTTIVCQGGAVPWDFRDRLTISRLRVALGRRLSDPPSGGFPAIDVAELNEFATQPPTGWFWYGVVAAFTCFAGMSVFGGGNGLQPRYLSPSAAACGMSDALPAEVASLS